MPLFYGILFCLGLIFWSFSTVLIERWKSGKWWIMLWRSECPQCHHTLGARELIPLFSYIIQRWKCWNCRSQISTFYPLAELCFSMIFCIMGYISMSFWNMPISWGTWGFLLLWFITGIYTLYDIRYMEIPDQIMVPSIVWYFILIVLWYYSWDLLFDLTTYADYSSYLWDHLWAAISIYSFFYLQILIPGGIYLLRKRKFRLLFELLYSYFLFPFELILSLFRRDKPLPQEDELEIPAWIGGWDLRIALFIGLTLWSAHTLSTLLFAYVIGSIVGISLLMGRRIRNHQIPFWPFLWIGWILSLIFYNRILNFF